MSSLKTTINNPKNRSALNTTIKTEVFNEFKKNCKVCGVPMNVLIEAFMRQFNEGGFYLKFGKEGKEKKIKIDFKED